MKLISVENDNMKNNYCYCILKYVKNHCVEGYLLVYHNSMDYFNVTHSHIHILEGFIPPFSSLLGECGSVRVWQFEGVAV